MKNSSKLIFLFTMIFGSMITISANSWLGVWMGLEINLLSFIPLMIDTNNLMSTEATLNYFLTQALASTIMLFSLILLMFLKIPQFQMNLFMPILSMMIIMTLFIKSGVAPFHFWFPKVMEGLTWYSNLILMTWQKIAPLIIISYLIKFSKIIPSFIILSAIMGALGGLNQTSLRKILAFSSINHLSWLLTAMMFNEYLWIMYFLIYSLLSFNLIFIFNTFKMFYLNQMFNFIANSNMMKFSLLISFLSLSGLPPFLGFLPKWIIIQALILTNQMMMILIMIFMSLITMYFYLRICNSAFMLNYTELIWNNKMFFNNKKFIYTINFLFISIFGLYLFMEFMYFFLN